MSGQFGLGGLAAVTFEDFFAKHRHRLEALYVSSDADRWSIALEAFARAAWQGLSRAAGAEPGRVPQLLDSLRIKDLALALACVQGNERAWNTFCFEYRPVLYDAARTLLGDESQARDLADSLVAEMYGLDDSAPGRNSRLAYFHGRSSLKTWLRSVLYQRFVDEYRRQSRLAPLPEGAAEPVATTRPVSEPDERRYDAYLTEAAEAALRDLPAQEKLLLGYAYVQQLTLKQIGRLTGVHEATISRHLEALRKKLRKRIEGYLRNVRKLSAIELDHCLDFARRGVRVELDRVLKPE